MANAPICHESRDEAFPTKQPSSIPNIPPATDLASAIAAINALRAAVMALAGRQQSRPPQPWTPQINNFQSTNSNTRWQEDRKVRVTQVVRVFNPKNKKQYVDVEQINGLTFADQKTGEKFQWKR